MAEYVPPYSNKPFAAEAKKVYYSLVGTGYCSGREDDQNIEKIRQVIVSATGKQQKARSV